MRASKLLGVIAMATMVATPVLAAAPVASANPAAALALPTAGNVRAASHGGKRNGALLGPLLIPALLVTGFGTFIGLAASGAFSSGSN